MRELVLRSLCLSPEDPPAAYTQAQVDEVVAQKLAAVTAKNTELIGEVRKVQESAKAWEGLNPAEVREMMAKKAEAEVERQKLLGDWGAREKDIIIKKEAEKEAALTAVNQQLEKNQKALYAKTVTAAVVEAVQEAGGFPVLKDSLMPKVSCVIIDDEACAVILDKDGRPRRSTKTGELMTPLELALEMKEMSFYQPMFASTVGSGSGTRSVDSTGGKVVSVDNTKEFMANVDDIASGKVKTKR